MSGGAVAEVFGKNKPTRYCGANATGVRK